MANKDVTTKVEEIDVASAISDRPSLTNVMAFLEGEIEDEYESGKQFDIKSAWKALLNLPSCGTIYLDEKIQKEIGLEVGVNVSQEFPWKQIKFRVLWDSMNHEVEGWKTFGSSIKNVSLDDLILIGYAPFLSKDTDAPELGDPFIAFGTHEAARQAGNIIKNIETYEKWMLNKQFIKYGKSWVSKGSEKEVDIMIPRKHGKYVDVEIESVYPIRLVPRSRLLSRTTSEVRDGYIELIPGEKKFENVFRKRCTVGIQSAPGMVSLEQQTDPTFPTNAWSQYLYEVNEAEEELDDSDVEEKPPPSKAVTPVQMEETPHPPPEVSDNVKDLLETLKFNQIDMYRNDYPLISENVVRRYIAPHMEEIVCFVNIRKSFKRYVCGVDWYPTLSGMVVTSYTFSTISSSVSVNDKTDVVARTIVEHNPVLMWSFDETLNFKLEFIAPREVTCLSFCPYDGNILIGGTINGQIILWDLQNRIAKLDYEEILTQSQSKYRELMEGFLAWTKPVHEEITIQPTAISVIETSQIGPITQINWLNRNHYVSKTGKVYESPLPTSRFFVTTSVDGSIAFWNLDAPVDRKKLSGSANRKLPAQLVQNVSHYKKYDRAMKPEFMIVCPEPITASICDVGIFLYEPEIPSKISRDFAVKVPITVKSIQQSAIRPQMFIGSFFGNVSTFDWDGFDFDSGEAVNKEKVSISKQFPKIHDGFVLEVLRNPHYRKIFASIGRNILAIWKENFNTTPIFWRKRPSPLTNIKWSHDRPSVLFLSRSDGYLEAWDFLTRSDHPCLVEPLGGGIITAISEHRTAVPKKVLGIGDYNSTFRMVVLPASFETQQPDELQRLKNIIKKENRRKQGIRDWEKEWLERNADIIQAKKFAEEHIILDLERIRREAEEETARRKKAEQEESIKAQMKAKSKKVFDLPEKLEQKWDEIILGRYMEVLMERTRVDREKLKRQTALEKDRLEYEKDKRQALKKSLKRIDEEVAAVRARLLPVQKNDPRRISLVKESIDSIIGKAVLYEEVENECNQILNNLPEYEDLDFNDLLDRGRLRREVINESLGSNTGRRHFYANLKRLRKTNQMVMGFERFMTKTTLSAYTVSTIISDAELEIPVKDEPVDIKQEDEVLEEFLGEDGKTGESNLGESNVGELNPGEI